MGRLLRVTSPFVCNVPLRQSVRPPERELRRNSLDNRLLCPFQPRVGFHLLLQLFLVSLDSALSHLAMQVHTIQLCSGIFSQCIFRWSFFFLSFLLLVRRSGGCTASTSFKFREPTKQVIASIDVNEFPFEQGVFCDKVVIE